VDAETMAVNGTTVEASVPAPIAEADCLMNFLRFSRSKGEFIAIT
jgi:hypothetical protein